MKMKSVFTKIILMAAIAGIITPVAEAEKYSKMVRRKTNAINDAIDNLRQRLNEVGVTAIAAEFKGVYAPVGRQNDIFVFCERGMNDAPEIHYWVSVNPLQGQFQITNWYSVNYQYIPYFVVLCPYGKQLGQWKGPGMGMQYKANPSYDSRTPVGSPVTPFVH